MTLMFTRIQVDDYDEWKEIFDAGRDGIRKEAKGHRIARGVDDPNELFIQVEFASPGDANAARERLLSSGALERVTVKGGPTVTEVAEAVTY
jgi:hypothetical protein